MSISSRARVVGALSVTGVAVGLGFGNAAAAEACTTPPPPTHDKQCDDRDDVQFKVDGASDSTWTDSSNFKLTVHTSTDVKIDVRYQVGKDQQPQSSNGGDHKGKGGSNGDFSPACDVTLAEYLTDALAFKDTDTQTLVDHSSVHLDSKHLTGTLDVGALDNTKGNCFAQIDLYWGNELFDGHDSDHPAPNGKKGITPISSAPGHLMIQSWNGQIATCQAPPPPTTPPSTPPPPPPSTPSTPPSSTTPPTPTSTTSTPTSTPPGPLTFTPPPTLAETGSNAFPLVLVALTLFGAGAGTMAGSRKLARKH